MMNKSSRRMIEETLPLKEVNLDSLFESSFRGMGIPKESRTEYYRAFGVKPMIAGPKLRNIHVWFARRPPSPARILTLAALLPSKLDANIELIKKAVGFENLRKSARELGGSLLIYASPDRYVINELFKKHLGREPKEFVVVDPMAGGGSIPLESLRLGFTTVAVEYNPVAYLILKAAVEFPAKYADAGLFEETLRVAEKFIAEARQELGKYYGEGSNRYIFARGIRCPFCHGLIPVQGVAPQITRKETFKKRFLRIEFDRQRKTFTAETTDDPPPKPLEKRGNNIRCPYCGRWFQLQGKARTGQTAFDKWFLDHATLMRSVVEELEQITPEMEERLLELHIPLVKQLKKGFAAIWGDKNEEGVFLRAFRDLAAETLELQDYIALDKIPGENRWASTARNKGLTHWYMLFNPRQLLAVAKLSKLVAQTAERLTSREGEFGAAVALYLALAIDKIADYNTIATAWHGTRGVIRNTIRGESSIDFRQEYAEAVCPGHALEWALETEVAKAGKYTRTAGGILPVLRFLCQEFRGAGLGDRISIYMGDATRLSEMLGAGAVDVVNVDPPYFDQVIYSDRSEFFWMILRRALAPVLEILFKPGLRLSGWSWTSPTVPREREIVARDEKDTNGGFRKLLKEFVRETYKVLKDDGVLVLWFTHPRDLAWRTVGEALYDAGYVVSKVWPIKTEMPTRYKQQVNLVAQQTSLVIVARKYARSRLIEVGLDMKRGLLNHPLFVRAAEEAVEDARRVSREAGASPADMMTLMLGSALSVATRFEVPRPGGFDSLFDAAATKVSELFVAPLLRRVLVEVGLVKLLDAEAERVLDNVRRAMLRDAAARSYVILWFLSRVDLQSGKPREPLLLLSYDFAQTVAKLLGYDIDNLLGRGLVDMVAVKEVSSVEPEEGGGRKSGKAFVPLMFEALSAAKARTTWSVLSTLLPGRALYLAYLALHESGAPRVRARGIREKVLAWTDEEVAEAASLSVVLLETARDKDLGFKTAPAGSLDAYLSGSLNASEAQTARELAVRALLYLTGGVTL
ncbi:MAG: hypothetical protein ABWK01_06460 [Infirmifilum sp.]